MRTQISQNQGRKYNASQIDVASMLLRTCFLIIPKIGRFLISEQFRRYIRYIQSLISNKISKGQILTYRNSLFDIFSQMRDIDSQTAVQKRAEISIFEGAKNQHLEIIVLIVENQCHYAEFECSLDKIPHESFQVFKFRSMVQKRALKC